MALPKYPPIKPGDRFGYLTVLAEAPHGLRANGKKVRQWRCRCVCGQESAYRDARLKSGNSRSCGCRDEERQRFGRLHEVDQVTGCWNWMGSVVHSGYGMFKLEDKARLAHRVSYAFRFGPIPDGLCVLHGCDNRRCVNPDHLSLGDNSENMVDMIVKQRGTARLTEAQVIAIRSEYAAGGVSQNELAMKFGIGSTQVCRIVQGKRWAHV